MCWLLTELGLGQWRRWRWRVQVRVRVRIVGRIGRYRLLVKSRWRRR